MTQKHPIDFEALEKGDVIEQAELEKIFNMRATNPQYRLRMLDLGLQIEEACRARGLLYRCDGFAIRIMTDQESEARTWIRQKQSLKSHAKNAERRARIDRSAFNPTELAVAEHRDRIGTAIMLNANRELRAAEKEERLLREAKAPER